MIVMCPQLPPEWRWDTPGAAQAVNGLVEQLCRRYSRIDPKRIYLTGLSMGGKGTWLTAENSPQTYAAVVPISAVDVRPDQAPQWLRDLPNLHIVCGSEDAGFTAGSHRMYEAMKPVLGDRVQLTVYPHEGHGVWDHLYASQGFYEELMKFSR
jgi:predicted peptidase